METLLSKRSKNLIPVFILGFIVLMVAVMIFFDPGKIPIPAVRQKLAANVEKIEARISSQVLELEERAEYLCEKYTRDQLEHSELQDQESLLMEKNGVVSEYYGEIYYFKFKPRATESWSLIRKNKDIYFIKNCGNHIYYVRFFFKINRNDYLAQLTYPFLEAEFKFFEPRLTAKKDEFQLDDIKAMFFYSHLMRSFNNQVMLFLKFSKNDILQFYHKRRNSYLFVGLLLFLMLSLFYIRGKKLKTARFLFVLLVPAIFVVGYLIISGRVKPDLYIHLPVGILNSIFELGVLVLFILILVTWLTTGFRKILGNPIVSFFLFNGLVMVILIICSRILASLNFLYTDFNFEIEYLMLLLILLFLHLIPLLVMRFVSIQSRTPVMVMGIASLQLLAGLAMILGLGFQVLSVIAFSLVFLGILFLKKKFLLKLLLLFLISVSVFQVIQHNALEEKKEFIAQNLKPIFLNQSNYAKLLVREIVHELNRYKDSFPDFFQGDWSSKLEAIWRGSLASRENIASGIFILSKGGELRSSYSYLVPFLKAESYLKFPLWAIEDTTAEVYGKKLSLAVATTSVFHQYDFLGRIIVQVLNSSDLILRSRDRLNIFTLNRKIDGANMSYITLNERNQILENPANINLKNIAGIIKFNNQWIRFKFMNLDFTGYIFEQNSNAIIIFFPENSLVKELSELIRIFLLFLVIFLLINIKELRHLQWTSIYYSFSVRVFVILILISLLTAIIYSIFSSDFYSRSAKIQSRHTILERGRTAQNIGNNFVEESGELTLNQIFLLSSILNKDVNVYDRGELLFTSNYRKIIQSTIPVFLHSNILHLLNKKNQEFVLVNRNDGFSLFFKIYEYIFNIEFLTARKDFIPEKRQYTDFIIVLFFLLLLIGITSAFFFRNKIISPIEELNRGMEEVERGNLTHLDKVPSEIELKSLYLGFNSMVDGIKEQKKNISEISRMKTLLKMGRRVAHEVKNPLTPIKLSAEQILRSIQDKRKGYEDMIEKSVNFIIDESDHLKKVSYGFLDFSRLDEINPEPFNLLRAVNEEVTSFKSLYTKINFITQSQGKNFEVYLDKLKIRQVVKNILINSIEAIGDKQGRIQISVKEMAERVIIEIIDNGSGLDSRELEFIFDEDYSTKEIGTGLGLFIVKRIVDLHQGQIEIKSKKNRGTTVILNLAKHVEKT